MSPFLRRRLAPAFSPAVAAAVAASCTATATAFGDSESDEDPNEALLKMERAAVAAHEARIAASNSVPDAAFFSRPGVIATRATPDAPWRIEVEAFATGLGTGQIVEFPLITLNSGHEYEAIFQTAAKAADIAAAFSYIGVAPGKSASHSDFRFWSRGERIAANVSYESQSAESAQTATAVPLASLTVEEGTNLPPPGGDLYVYIGGGGFDVDSTGPGSIVSTYNEPATLLDVPRLAEQRDVYGTVLSAPGTPEEQFKPAKIVFSPEVRAESLPAKRDIDVALSLSPDGFSIDGGEALTPAATAAALSAARREREQDSYISFSWTPDVVLRDLAAAARLLAALEDSEAQTGVRIDEPPVGFPYYKAFLPQEEWRDRAKRLAQPSELRFAPDAKGATLVKINEKWSGDSLEPEISTEELSLDEPTALPEALKANAPDNLRVLLVFAPASATWGEIAPWLDAARKTHPVAQIFLD